MLKMAPGFETDQFMTIDVPSPAAPNLNFGPDESVIYIMAVDDQSNAPYWGKLYEVSKAI